MNVYELASSIGARVLTAEQTPPPHISSVYAGDRMSDLVSQAGSGTLLVTNLDGSQLLRVAALMDSPALCFVGGLVPDPERIAAAAAQGTVLLVSPHGLYETCGLLFQALGRRTAASPPGSEP